MSTIATHLVFVDFENVPSFDLDLIAHLPVFVTVLIGKTQTKLDMNLALQVARHAGKVELLQTTASGRNALDLILAYHLGRATVDSPGATLHVISKDRDFDPLLAHLSSTGIAASRSESFSELPFLPSPATRAAPKKKSPPKKETHPPSAAPTAPASSPSSDPVMEKIILRLRTEGSPRPKRKTTLLRHIDNCYGKRLTPAELDQKLHALVAARLLNISPEGKVTY